MTISEVAARCADHRSECGRSSGQFQEQVDELKKMVGYFKIELVCQPDIGLRPIPKSKLLLLNLFVRCRDLLIINHDLR